MPKISIIVPIYGVEKYIERCVRSLFEQTLDDLEYIFVDDCTLDHSMEILKQLIEEYHSRLTADRKSVKVLRMHVNSGLAEVRKYGLKFCTGDYIFHCDSDDWADVNMCRWMYEEAIKHEADIVLCDFYSSDGKNTRYYIGCNSIEKIKVLYDLLERKISWAVWNKLVKRSLYQNNIHYPQNANGEDLVLTSQLIYFAKKIAYVHKALYYYYCNNNSITRLPTPEGIVRRFSDLGANINIIDAFFSTKLEKRRYENIIVNLKFMRKTLFYPILSDYAYYLLWRNTSRNINYKLLFNPLVKFKEKIKFYLYLIRILK